MIHRVALLGGGVGTSHLDAYLALPDRFRVTHICDRDEDRAAALAKRAVARTSSDIDAILDDPDVDVVDICLPPYMHAEISRRALEAGKHVVCEKPMAGSIVEAESLETVDREARGRLFPVFQYRYGRAVRLIQALDRAGLLGAPVTAALETHWNRDTKYYANPWRGTWEYEMGGAVLSHAIHIHDLICQLFGPIAFVSAMLATRVNAIETEDCATVSMETTDGALISSSITLGAAEDRSRLSLVYDRVSIESGGPPYAPATGGWRFIARDRSWQAAVDEVIAGVGTDEPEGFAGYLTAIADAIEGDGDNAVSVRDGVASIELATAVYYSARTGRHVSLPLDRSLPICRSLRPL